jgi:hypothetical protein
MTTTRALCVLCLCSLAFACHRTGESGSAPADGGAERSRADAGDAGLAAEPKSPQAGGRPIHAPAGSGGGIDDSAGYGPAPWSAGGGGVVEGFGGHSGGGVPWAGGGAFFVPTAGRINSAGTTAPYYGGFGGGEVTWMTGGGQSCECDDHDPCTDDWCSSTSGCRYETRVTEPIDRDADGFDVGCDCDDTNGTVHPLQSEFFAEPAPMGDSTPFFDYDCDYRVTPLLASDARPCELHPAGMACLGDGWVDGQPECGVKSDYQVCEFEDGACIARVVDALQRCR